MPMTAHGSYRSARTYRRVAFASILIGTFGLLVASGFGYGLSGLFVYVVGALIGFGLIGYVRMSNSLSLGDERLYELERRASHYAVVLIGFVGWVVLVGVSLLEATGYREMTSVEETLLMAFGTFFLVWGVVYAILRFIR